MKDLKSIARTWAEAFAAPMPQGIDALLALAAEDVRFADPFNDVRGKPALREILEDMVARCEDPAFAILDVGAGDKAGYIRWEFRFRPKGRRDMWTFSGMSEILADDAGLVTAHIDHWDSGSQLYAKLPLIGWPVRRIAKSLSVTPPRA